MKDGNQTFVTVCVGWHSAIDTYVGWENDPSVEGCCLHGARDQKTYFSSGVPIDAEAAIAAELLCQ